MVDISLFSIPTSRLKLGAVLARGSPGITLYQAELQLRKYVTKVCLTCLLEPLSIQAAFTGMCPAGGSEEAADRLCSSCSRGCLS